VPIDRLSDGTDANTELLETTQTVQDRHPTPDSPGAEGLPSRADSRNAAAVEQTEGRKQTETPEVSTPRDDSPAKQDDPVFTGSQSVESKPEQPGERTSTESDAPAGQTSPEITDPESEPGDGAESKRDPAVDATVEQGQPDEETAAVEDVINEDVPLAADRQGNDDPADNSAQSAESHDSVSNSETDLAKEEQDGQEPGVSLDSSISDDLTNRELKGAIVGDDAAEGGFLGRVKQSIGMLNRDDRPGELSGTVDRPDFQDQQVSPERRPDRYGTPLERADGTRTPLFDGEPRRE
jgi:hypothetical protein